MMRNRRRVTVPPVSLTTLRRNASVPKVELLPGLLAKSLTRLGGADESRPPLPVPTSQCFKSFHTAERTLEGIESVNMIRKGQVKRLKGLRGQVHVTFEEGTHAAWLYDVLKKRKVTVIVCDPRKNRLLQDGNKSDRVDARKLAQLLRAD
jgi:hypothetical protein